MRPVLLVAYKFPPYIGVGAYRWTKLSKHLALQGRPIHVISISWKGNGDAALCRDVALPGITVHRTRDLYPHELLKKLGGESRWRRAIVRRIFEPLRRQFWFDGDAQQWGRYSIPESLRVIDQYSIGTVIATGPPFHANLFAARLKEMRPHVHLIQDFRDPWSEDPFKRRLYGNAGQLRKAEQWQAEAVQAADDIVSITAGCLDLFRKNARLGTRFHVVPNGFDRTAIDKVVSDNVRTTPQYEFVYFGTIGSGRDKPLRAFLNAVRLCAERGVYIRTLIIGADHNHVLRDFPELGDKGLVDHRAPLPQVECFRLARMARFALQLTAEEYPYLLSTKIYEYAALQLPTLALHYGGDIETLVRDYDLGVALNLRNSDLAIEIERLVRQPSRVYRLEIDAFDHAELARKYQTIIDLHPLPNRSGAA